MASQIARVLSPAQAIKSAMAAHPAFRFAMAVAGLAGIVAIALRYGPSAATLVFGSIILVVLMVLFLVFAQAAAARRANLALPSTILVWSFLVLSIMTASGLFASAFFDSPLPLKTKIVQLLGVLPPEKAPPTTDKGATPDEKVNQPSPGVTTPTKPETERTIQQTRKTSTEGSPEQKPSNALVHPRRRNTAVDPTVSANPSGKIPTPILPSTHDHDQAANPPSIAQGTLLPDEPPSYAGVLDPDVFCKLKFDSTYLGNLGRDHVQCQGRSSETKISKADACLWLFGSIRYSIEPVTMAVLCDTSARGNPPCGSKQRRCGVNEEYCCSTIGQ